MAASSRGGFSEVQPVPTEALVHQARARGTDAYVVCTLVRACTWCRISFHEPQAGLPEKAHLALSLCAGVGTWTMKASSSRGEPGWCPSGWRAGFTHMEMVKSKLVLKSSQLQSV